MKANFHNSLWLVLAYWGGRIYFIKKSPGNFYIRMTKSACFQILSKDLAGFSSQPVLIRLGCRYI